MLLSLMTLLACNQTTPPPPPIEYTVVRGDTLSKIAREYGVSVDAIRQANGLSGDLIEIDQVLTIPRADEAVAASTPKKRSGGGARRTGGSSSGGSVPEAAPPQAALSLPAEKDCLDGPSLDDLDGDEPAMAASVGLSHSQVSSAMNAFIGQTSRCIEGDWPVGVITLDVTVACTGRVSGVSVVDRGGLSAELASCVADTLRYAAFPAHDMPDGFTFGYPLRFSAQ